jgi:hypothetical protein
MVSAHSFAFDSPRWGLEALAKPGRPAILHAAVSMATAAPGTNNTGPLPRRERAPRRTP